MAISFLFHKKSYWINQIFIVITSGPKPSLEGSEHSWFPIFHKTTAFQGSFSLEPTHRAKLKCSDGQNPHPWGKASQCLEAFQWTTMCALSPSCIAPTVALLTEAPPNYSDNKTQKFISHIPQMTTYPSAAKIKHQADVWLQHWWSEWAVKPTCYPCKWLVSTSSTLQHLCMCKLKIQHLSTNPPLD